jgi:hypothetical protein
MICSSMRGVDPVQAERSDRTGVRTIMNTAMAESRCGTGSGPDGGVTNGVAA